MKRQIALIAPFLVRKVLEQIPILILLVLAGGYGQTNAQTLTTLHQFGSSPTDGQIPTAGLVQGSDGSFYGTTFYGGTNTIGVVFQLSVPLTPPANQIAGIEFFNVFNDSRVAIRIPSVAGETYQLQYSDSMDPNSWINTGDPVTSIGGPLTTFDLVEPGTSQRFYRFATVRIKGQPNNNPSRSCQGAPATGRVHDSVTNPRIHRCSSHGFEHKE
jgi:uncharacterized repeat protein (TIGR03803 family)